MNICKSNIKIVNGLFVTPNIIKSLYLVLTCQDIKFRTCTCFFKKSIPMYSFHRFISLEDNAYSYTLQCLSEKFHAKETRADFKVSFNHTLQSLSLWGLQYFFLCSHTSLLISFSYCQKMAIFHFQSPERVSTSASSQFIQDSIHHRLLRLQKLNKFLKCVIQF